MSGTTGTPLWNQIVSKGEEAVKAGRAAIAKQVLQHRFQSAHTDAQSRVLDLRTQREQVINSLVENPLSASKTFNVNTWVHINADIADVEADMASMEEAYTEFFGDTLARTALEAEDA